MNTLLLSKNLGIIKNYLTSGSKIGFVPTAGETYDNPWFVVEDRQRLNKMNYNIEDIDITNLDKTSIKNKLNEIDALFVSGGNVFYLMQQIRKKDIVEEFINFINSDKLYIGTSAGGCICSPTLEPYKAFDNIDDAKDLLDLNGLKIIDFILLPHYGKEKYLHLYDDIINQYKDKYELVTLHDNEAIVLKSNNEYDIVSSDLI
ncbi:MAG: Type 1 glutamine amidotransferase-like domain-containing protein [Clostridia bacterium]|nr:Type 1 glutamine amidotransferase-like domain-containing protein [Clostridia bacterium]